MLIKIVYDLAQLFLNYSFKQRNKQQTCLQKKN